MEENLKQLLLKDLCARLPYNVVIRCTDNDTDYKCFLTTNILNELLLNTEYYDYKPYLRPMSSMTEEEKKECNKTKDKIAVQWDDYGTPVGYEYAYTIKTFDWLLANHFDFRHLIQKGLALGAPNGMYKIE